MKRTTATPGHLPPIRARSGQTDGRTNKTRNAAYTYQDGRPRHATNGVADMLDAARPVFTALLTFCWQMATSQTNNAHLLTALFSDNFHISFYDVSMLLDSGCQMQRVYSYANVWNRSGSYCTLCPKNISDIFDCNLKNNYQILIIFDTNFPDTTCHQTAI